MISLKDSDTTIPVRELQQLQFKKLQEKPSVEPVPKDPLIAWNLDRVIYIGVFLLAISILVAVGLLSRRFEYALLFALVLSALLIAGLIAFLVLL
jgi:hypothetical protein